MFRPVSNKDFSGKGKIISSIKVAHVIIFTFGNGTTLDIVPGLGIWDDSVNNSVYKQAISWVNTNYPDLNQDEFNKKLWQKLNVLLAVKR